jgi:hypothetical protein
MSTKTTGPAADGEGAPAATTNTATPIIESVPPGTPNINITVPSAEGRFTEQDLHRVREEEKSKLYGRIEDMAKEVDTWRKEREEAERLRREAEERAEAERIEREKAEMTAIDRIAALEDDFAKRMDLLQQEREQEREILAKEQEYRELMDYRNRRMVEEQGNIIPDLIDLVSGNSPEEIERSIATLKEKTAAIVGSVQSTLAQQQGASLGTRVTDPSGFPEMITEQGTVNLSDIKNMNMDEYAKNRERLLGAVSRRTGRSQF